jgi:hypothetical protein
MTDIPTQEREFVFKNREGYREAMASAPPEGSFHERAVGGGNMSRYVPIQVQEALADTVFESWHVTDIDSEIFNGYIKTKVKIKYLPSFPDAEEMIVCGLAITPYAGKKDGLDSKQAGILVGAIAIGVQDGKRNALKGLGNLLGRNAARGVKDDFRIITNGGTQTLSGDHGEGGDTNEAPA